MADHVGETGAVSAHPLICIDPSTLRAWLSSGDTVLIDVRQPAEHALEHISGARSIPLCKLDRSFLPRHGRIVLFCASGNRSRTAARRLAVAGLAHLEGGLAAWKASGLPTVTAARPPLPVLERFEAASQLA